MVQTVTALTEPTAVRLSKKERQIISNRAALAVLAKRFPDGVVGALNCPDFAGATRYYIDEGLKKMRAQPEAAEAAAVAESGRKEAAQALACLPSNDDLNLALRDEPDYVDERFQELLGCAGAGVDLSAERLQAWKTFFEKLDEKRLREMAFQFSCHAWAGLQERAPPGKQARGMPLIVTQCTAIFGAKATWSDRTIKDSVKEGRKSSEAVGKRSFPLELEEKLVSFITRLRELKQPVYKQTVFFYAKGLLQSHEARLNFSQVNAEGEYVQDEEGNLMWDYTKLGSWYYRRLLGDRPELTTGNQRILDAARAKWGTAKNMRVHYDNLIRVCLDNGICIPNPRFDAEQRDKDGVPLEPEVLWVDGERYRVMSFDEMKADDKTHGDGDRKGRCERSLRAGKRDDGECVGNKHASHPCSAVGGTNGAGEALPCFLVTASTSFDLNWVANGPKTTINGKTLLMDGTCNPKGSVNNATAIEYVRRIILRVLEARERPTAERKAVLVCDGVGSHLSCEFIDFLVEHHIILILRTPNCSQKQQPEDLVSFQRVKNCKGQGFYLAKQEAVVEQLATTASAALAYDVIIGTCLRPAWEAGFSTPNNLEAWQKAGLNERGGITARPYWEQLRAEQPLRRVVRSEARTRAIEQFGLGQEANWAALMPSWALKGPAALMVTDEPSAEGDEGAEGTEGTEGGKGGRLTSGELSQLKCAATDPAARKYLQFKGDISAIKTMKAQELKEELTALGPGAPAYTTAPEAKVALLRALERLYTSTPSLRQDGHEVTGISWVITARMVPADLKAIMFPKKAAEPATPALPAPKKRKLGEGAFACTQVPEGRPSLLLAAPPTPVPLQLTGPEQPQAEALEQAKPVPEPLLPSGGGA